MRKSRAHHFLSVIGVKLSPVAFIGPPRTNGRSVSLSKFPPLFMSTDAGDEWKLRRGGRPGDETISVGETGNVRPKVTWSQSSTHLSCWGFNYSDLTFCLQVLKILLARPATLMQTGHVYLQELLPLFSKQRLDGLLYECIK